jgi:hypothetical protein
MNRRPPLRWPLALVAVTVPLTLAACGRVPGQFEILNDQVPTTAAGGGCTIPVNPTIYQGMGTLDISIVRGDFQSAYDIFPLIENNLPRSSSNSSIDPNEIQLSGFQIDIAPIGAPPPASIQAVFDGAGPLVHYQVSWAGGISSGGGQLSATVRAFPVGLAQQLSAAGGIGVDPSLTVDLTIQALGITNNGTSMQSDPFHFPVAVCSGCLVANVAPCPYAAAPVNTGNSCNAAQDLPVDCCTDNGTLICPPTVAVQ